ncbi:MAG: 2-hydroxymuconic semialdehyde dehydrogenase [Halopseudomonas sp.]
MSTPPILNFIDGHYTEGTSGRTFEDRSPVDNRLVGIVHEAGPAEVDAAVTAAKQALEGPWGRMNSTERAALLNRVADLIMEQKDAFIAAEINDTGKPYGPTAQGEIPRSADQFRVFAQIMLDERAPEPIETPLPRGGRALNYEKRVPKGVIATICPWNLPLIMATWKLAPALACGNTVVIKPSEETPASVTLLGKVMNEAGIPPGVVNVVHGFGVGSAGQLLVQHKGVDAVTFTGETGSGAAIMQDAARDLKDVSLELGGKNPALIFADCDLEKAIQGTAMSAFHNCGQVCLGTERVYVERSIFPAFVEGLKQQAEGLRPGSPFDKETTLGPLSSLKHRDKALTYMQKAVEEGAEVITGGGVPEMPSELVDGAWVQPTIWTGLPETSAVVQEEIFGPFCHVQPFDAEDEAIAMANNTEYGLAAAVWSQDKEKAGRVANQLKAGVIWVNGWMIRDLRTPFGGFNKSGIGREGGRHSLEFYTEIKNICVVQ